MDCKICSAGVVAAVLVVVATYHLWRRVTAPHINMSGKRVLITGGSKGIGFEIAKSVLAKGGSVAIVARNENVLRHARKELESLKINDSQTIVTLNCDVTNLELFEHTLRTKLKDNKWDSLDCVVCNAGVECTGTVTELDISKYRRVMDVNYFGTVQTIQLCLPFLKANSQPSRILVVSSMLGLLGLPFNSAYAGSKYALRGFVNCIALELRAYNIHCQIVYPPDVDTDQFKREKANTNAPKAIAALSDDAGVFSPAVVGSDIVAMLESGKYNRTWGLDGFMLLHLCAGMTPNSSLIDTCIQVFLMGLFRLIALFYSKEHASVSAKHCKQ